MTRSIGLIFSVFLPFLVSASENPSAFEAIKAVPEEEVRRLARIEARGGTPAPEQWHILVHVPESETGLKEFVVAKGELVAVRDSSQFSEGLNQGDVIAGDPIEVDSDDIAEIVARYAAANKAAIATVNYQLLKEGEEAQPVWHIGCLAESGETVGTIVVTAGKGTVVSHEGFPIVPKERKSGQKAQKSALRFETESVPLVATGAEAEELEEATPELPATPVALANAETKVLKSAPSKNKKRVSKSSRAYRKADSTRRSVVRYRAVRRSGPVSVARRATMPVRKVIRRILPF